MRGNFGWVVGCALVMEVAVVGSAQAVERDFSVVTNQSNITASGTVTFAGTTANIQPQGTGSLTTSYSGTIKTDRESSSISFLAGSSVSANVNGNWKPDANAANNAQAADYGGKAIIVIDTANFAARDLVVGVTSGAITLDSGSHFDLSSATLSFASAKLAYLDTFGQLMGSSDLSGKTTSIAGTGSISGVTQGGQTTETLTVPINSTFVLAPTASSTVNLTLTGQLIATTTFAAGLAGDFDQNGVVDAADYVAWRKGVLVASTPANYNLWRANFGTHAGSGASLSFAAVPEASASTLTILAVVANIFLWRKREM